MDSLVIYWPSGIIDKHYDMQINTAYLLEEGETNDLFKINPNSCLDSLNSIGSVQFPILLWPDQSTANPYETSENNLTVLTNTGFGNSVSLTIQIPEYVPPQLSTSFESPACLGQDNGSISSFLIRSDIDTLSSIQWNALPPGTYTLEHVFDDGCLMQDSINLEYANSISLTNLHLTPNCWNDSSSTLQALIEGGTPPYNNQFYNDTIYYANIPSGPFHLEVADAINCSVDTTVVIPFVPAPIITLSVDSTFSPIYEFHAESSNSESTFMWNNNFSGSLFTADISSGLALELTVTDNNGCVSDTLWYFQPPTNMYTLENGK
ncbi:MAG: hypothetical protein ACKO8Q_06695, partial [Bacteroidota bacterium]